MRQVEGAITRVDNRSQRGLRAEGFQLLRLFLWLQKRQLGWVRRSWTTYRRFERSAERDQQVARVVLVDPGLDLRNPNASATSKGSRTILQRG